MFGCRPLHLVGTVLCFAIDRCETRLITWHKLAQCLIDFSCPFLMPTKTVLKMCCQALIFVLLPHNVDHNAQQKWEPLGVRGHVFRCTLWLCSEHVFHIYNVKYESVLRIYLYCGLEIKNVWSSSRRLDLGILNNGKHPVQFETFEFKDGGHR